MAQKQKLINFRADDSFRDTLLKAAEILDIPYAQILREGAKEKIERLARRNEKLAKAIESIAA